MLGGQSPPQGSAYIATKNVLHLMSYISAGVSAFYYNLRYKVLQILKTFIFKLFIRVGYFFSAFKHFIGSISKVNNLIQDSIL